jgi:hypothetical protein
VSYVTLARNNAVLCIRTQAELVGPFRGLLAKTCALKIAIAESLADVCFAPESGQTAVSLGMSALCQLET